MRKPPFSTPELAAELQAKQELARRRCANDPEELQVLRELESTGYRWARKAILWHRLLDFWNAELGIVVQIDRARQDDADEAYWDEYAYRRSSILVLRIDNRKDLDEAVETIKTAELWNDRRARLGKLVVTSEHVHAPSAAQRSLGF